MSANLDARDRAIVRIRPARKGSCLNDEVRQDLEESIEVELPPVKVDGECLGADPDNLLSRDAQGCLQVLWTPPETQCLTVPHSGVGNSPETTTTLFSGFSIPLEGVPIVLNVSSAENYRSASWTLTEDGDVEVIIAGQTDQVEVCVTAFVPQTTTSASTN